MLGNKDKHDRLVGEIANERMLQLFSSISHRLQKPKYSAPIEEAYAATKYISEYGRDLNLDASKLTVAGDSVGGNMAAGVLLLAKERSRPTIIYQVLFYPVTDAKFDTQSTSSLQPTSGSPVKQ